eukprot:3816087-Prorocentrum_lima.AAC.1
MLLRSGANLLDGFLSLTKTFKWLHYECYKRNQMIEDFYYFFDTMSTVPTPVTPLRDITSRLLTGSGEYDQRTG